MSFLEQLAQAYLARERQRLGIPQEQRAERAAGDENMLRQAKLKQTLQELELAPAAAESTQALQEAHAKEALSRGKYYEAGGHQTTLARGTLRPKLNDAGEVIGYYLDKPGEAGVESYDAAGQPVTDAQPGAAATQPFRTKPKPAPPKPERPIAITTVDEKGNPVQSFVTPDQARRMAAGGSPGIAKPLTGDAASRLITSQAILGTVGNINSMLDDPEIAGNLGPIAGRMTQGEKFVGTLSPKMAKLYGAIHGFAMASYAAHGYRSAQDMERTMAQDLGPRFSADTLKAAIEGLTEFPRERVRQAPHAAPIGTSKYKIISVEQ